MMLNLISTAAALFNLTHDDVLSHSRRQPIVFARRMVVVYLRQEGLTYKEIGGIFGIDHTTCISHIKKHDDMICTNYKRYTDKWKMFVNLVHGSGE